MSLSPKTNKENEPKYEREAQKEAIERNKKLERLKMLQEKRRYATITDFEKGQLAILEQAFGINRTKYQTM